MHATRAGSTFSIFITFHDFASALNSHFDRHMGLSEFALSLVTCAQLSSWARTANTHGNIGCAFYASTAAQNTPEHVKEAQIQPRARLIQPRAAQIKPKPSQIKAKPAKIKSGTAQISKYQANSNRHHQMADLDEHTIFAGHFTRFPIVNSRRRCCPPQRAFNTASPCSAVLNEQIRNNRYRICIR